MHISKINDILNSIKEIDVETYDHLERTAMFSFALAKELKLEPKQQEQAYFSGLLHDLGVLSNVERDTKECNDFGAMMLRFVDGSEDISKVIKHQHDFFLQEEGFLTLLSEIVALASNYDEYRKRDGLQHKAALEKLKDDNFKESLLIAFDNILKREDLIEL